MLDDPTNPVKIEIAVIIEGEAINQTAAYDLVCQFQHGLDEYVAQNFNMTATGSMKVGLSQATYGDHGGNNG